MQGGVERKLRGIDILSLGLAAVCVVEAALGLAVQPRYRAMFADFGSALPFFTELMLRPATLIVVGLLPMILAVEGVLRRRTEAAQVARSVVAIIVAVGQVAAFFGAMYLPIFTLAGQLE